MINRCRYGIVLKGVFSASGHDELHAAFIKKSTAEQVLRETVPNPRERRSRYSIVRLPDWKEAQAESRARDDELALLREQIAADPHHPSLIVCPDCHHPVRDMTAHLAFNHRRGL